MSNLLRTIVRASVPPKMRQQYSQVQRTKRLNKWLDATKGDRKIRNQRREFNREQRARKFEVGKHTDYVRLPLSGAGPVPRKMTFRG